MTAHSAQLTKMRLPDRAIMLKAVSKAKNPILVKRKKMFKLGLARDSFFFYSICDSLYLTCSKTPLNPRLFTAVLSKRLYCYIRHIHHAFIIKSHRSYHGFIKRACQTPSLLTHPFAFPLVSSLAFAASFLPPVFIISFLNFLGYARGKYLVLQPRFYVGCHVFDSWFDSRSRQVSIFCTFPICLQYFLSHIHCFGCFCFQFFPFYSFSATAAGISVLQGSPKPCRITGA